MATQMEVGVWRVWLVRSNSLLTGEMAPDQVRLRMMELLASTVQQLVLLLLLRGISSLIRMLRPLHQGRYQGYYRPSRYMSQEVVAGGTHQRRRSFSGMLRWSRHQHEDTRALLEPWELNDNSPQLP